MQHMLIVATSGRALAQCAARSGYSSVVLDCFGDLDTRAAAHDGNVVADASGLALDRLKLLDAVEEICPPRETDALIYGAGFESDPDLLERFSRRYTLRGNPPDVVRRVKDPATLARLLDGAGLPHPQTRFDPPGDPSGWLIKRIGGTGGLHVARCGDRAFEAGLDYFQREVHGTVCSALFLAGRAGTRIVGVSEALPPGDGVRAPFAYAGAISHAAISMRVREELAARLDMLASQAGLVGLNGIDFIVQGESFSVLEINPRPTATLELYDPDITNGLLAAHVAVCADQEVTLEQSWGPVRAHAVVFAQRQLRLPANWRPARWCADIPQPGAVIEAGMPICSVRAEGVSRTEVKTKIAQYRAAVLDSCEEIAA